MKAVIVEEPGAPLAVQETDTPEPAAGEVLLRVHACGICHSDQVVVNAIWPGLELPRIPGHEVVGVVEATGDGVRRFAAGDRVGVGWHGGHDGTCDHCLAGKFIHCDNGEITGITRNGGYAEYTVVPEVALARVPDGMALTDAAPLLCAGITTFNSLRNAGARPGDVVGVQGLGGLGHLGVQYARAMGFETVAISRGRDKEDFARQLGAHHYVDAEGEDVAGRFAEMGGARVILATAPHADAISALTPALGVEGTLLVVAAAFEPLQISALDLISKDARVQGWASGTASDSEAAMAFAQQHGIKSMNEVFPLDEAATAYDRMLDGSVRFRSVLQIGAD
jgi:D-arabinose 1-dehydrogenase-like Zn-dependent alcohol dehydrogenase